MVKKPDLFGGAEMNNTDYCRNWKRKHRKRYNFYMRMLRRNKLVKKTNVVQIRKQM